MSRAGWFRTRQEILRAAVWTAAHLCRVVGPLAVHVELVLMLPLRKINDGREGVLTLTDDRGRGGRVNTALLFFFTAWLCRATLTFRHLKDFLSRFIGHLHEFRNKQNCWQTSLTFEWGESCWPSCWRIRTGRLPFRRRSSGRLSACLKSALCHPLPGLAATRETLLSPRDPATFTTFSTQAGTKNVAASEESGATHFNVFTVENVSVLWAVHQDFGPLPPSPRSLVRALAHGGPLTAGVPHDAVLFKTGSRLLWVRSCEIERAAKQRSHSVRTKQRILGSFCRWTGGRIWLSYTLFNHENYNKNALKVLLGGKDVLFFLWEKVLSCCWKAKVTALTVTLNVRDRSPIKHAVRPAVLWGQIFITEGIIKVTYYQFSLISNQSQIDLTKC